MNVRESKDEKKENVTLDLGDRGWVDDLYEGTMEADGMSNPSG